MPRWSCSTDPHLTSHLPRYLADRNQGGGAIPDPLLAACSGRQPVRHDTTHRHPVRGHLCRDGAGARSRLARRPRRHRHDRGGRAGCRRRGADRRADQRHSFPDLAAARRPDDIVGAGRRQRLLRRRRGVDRRPGGPAAAPACPDHRRRRRAVGAAGQRHRGVCDDAAAVRRPDGAQPRPAAVPVRACRRQQCRLGRHADRQSPEHPDRPGRQYRLLVVFRGRRRAGAGRPGDQLRMHRIGVALEPGCAGRRARRLRRSRSIASRSGPAGSRSSRCWCCLPHRCRARSRRCWSPPA